MWIRIRVRVSTTLYARVSLRTLLLQTCYIVLLFFFCFGRFVAVEHLRFDSFFLFISFFWQPKLRIALHVHARAVSAFEISFVYINKVIYLYSSMLQVKKSIYVKMCPYYAILTNSILSKFQALIITTVVGNRIFDSFKSRIEFDNISENNLNTQWKDHFKRWVHNSYKSLFFKHSNITTISHSRLFSI